MSTSGEMGSTSVGPINTPAGVTRAVVRPGAWVWLGASAAVLLCAALYRDGLAYLVHIWSIDENYGHGFFVPLISGYLIWEKRHELLARPLQGSWAGLGCVIAAVFLYLVGEYATLYVMVHVSMWLMVVGLVLTVVGPTGLRTIMFPIAFLLTMIPMPDFLYQGLSSKLQLVSSALGVGCLQIVGVTAFREGNVIDLGPIQLQVVEACSGLRYLFPLAALALLCAYLFKDRLWKRIVLFLSSFPISILLNGFRIGMIGVLVDVYGEGMAEGFSHFFEGWLIFVVSLCLLFVEIWVLARIGSSGQPRTWASLLSLGGRPTQEAVELAGPPAMARSISLGPAFLASLAILLATTVASAHGLAQEEVSPKRQAFVDFPLHVEAWSGHPLVMEQTYIDVLRFDDYVLADYRRVGEAPVNLYVAYYRSQKKGQSAHSPRSCLPGGGWEIVSLEDLQLHGRQPITVNRVEIQKDDQKQLVLYWFQQRGRNLSNEYLVKWYLLWDLVTKQRSDGALVRMTTAIEAGESMTQAEGRLIAFADSMRPLFAKYVPD